MNDGEIWLKFQDNNVDLWVKDILGSDLNSVKVSKESVMHLQEILGIIDICERKIKAI